jgi:hypothetical protein
MGTNLQKKAPEQIQTIEELSKRVIELEQEKLVVSQRHQEVETRVGKLESLMNDLTAQLSAFRPGTERSTNSASQVTDWLSAYSESEQADLKKKKEEFDNIVTCLTA